MRQQFWTCFISFDSSGIMIFIDLSGERKEIIANLYHH
ncbi:hypothetical protein GJA_3955 [Janthinobacterium agaricidamnosum NBRC 102515 = DSM 9628]|uniref:Uncharacterized protein n=1 Tax=Janthinobacterium agaricidamnosum NBRC 102515 = DSM 9628 TaxID=1349767 RepID=W0V9J7_9BURK|nr:hypothetical protein GJA_3955 [Janthinobacterium agaricidamnosum NBRC 102515 = DSM 9628]